MEPTVTLENAIQTLQELVAKLDAIAYFAEFTDNQGIQPIDMENIHYGTGLIIRSVSTDLKNVYDDLECLTNSQSKNRRRKK